MQQQQQLQRAGAPTLASIYYDASDPGGYAALEPLLKSAREKGINASRRQINDFLAEQDAYTLHRQYRKRYQRNPIVVGGIDKQWQADLADMTSLSKHNDGFKYLLTVIDCFSKYAWAIPLKSKSSSALVLAFKTLLHKSNPRKPNRLQTDKGTEFLNKDLQEFFNEKAIHHFASESDQKAAMAERFNRTLKGRMWRYFTANNTYRYVDVLDDLLHAYNHAKHRTIGMAPADVKVEHEDVIWNRMYPCKKMKKNSSSSSNPLKPNDKVRLSKMKNTFEKGYMPNWTEEIFNISSKSQGPRQTVYKLRDWADEPIKGIFYPEEVQKVVTKADKTFRIEKILKRKKVAAGKKLYLVKWRGYPDKFNSWIDSRDVAK